MSEKKPPFYITTTIPYVNAAPHVGHALEFVQADVLARFKRLAGYEVFFNFGTDEHGQKIWEKAQAEGKDTQDYVDFYADKFKELRVTLDLSYDAFIRTTDTKHKAAAQEMWRRCSAAGDIYKKQYQIKYCIGCEMEKTDSELVNGECPLHPGKSLETREEENYFFRLSQYGEKLMKLYSLPDFLTPDSRLNELRSLESGAGMQDFSISRLATKMPWGIAVPDDTEHVMYVWFDALVNYISTLDWPQNEAQFSRFWNGTRDCVQMAGKDQVRQQAAMWQAMLMSAKLPTTGRIFIHGFINSAGQKMSKSIGNVIEPISIVNEYGADALRYYLLRHIHPFEDSDMTIEKFKEAYNADLANGLGNLAARVMTLSEKWLSGVVAPSPARGEGWGDVGVVFPEAYTNALEHFEFNRAIETVWHRIETLDRRIAEEEPFKVVKVDEEKGRKMISNLVSELSTIALLLEPMLPATSYAINSAIKANKKPETLFPRKE